MAKISMINRDLKRKRLAKKFADKRLSLKRLFQVMLLLMKKRSKPLANCRNCLGILLPLGCVTVVKFLVVHVVSTVNLV